MTNISNSNIEVQIYQKLWGECVCAPYYICRNRPSFGSHFPSYHSWWLWPRWV